MPRSPGIGTLFGVVVIMSAFQLFARPRDVVAQLISPGKLSAAHADLEGIRNCTQCHELRKQGISETLCLGCHVPLGERMAAEKGFHASLPDKACATCHKEHFGVDFALVRLDSLTFDHRRAGYELDGSHVDVSCRACHTPGHIQDDAVRAAKEEHGALDRTFLGLSSECGSCHATDGPHEEQFAGRSCAECHDTGTWKEAPAFDHGRTAFPLTGEHRTVACADCHSSTPRPAGRPPLVRYTGIPNNRCNDCHEDEHHGAMPGPCQGCHTTAGWNQLDRRRLESSFDHDVTGFALEGRHSAIPCASCHDASAAGKLDAVHLTFSPGQSGSAFPRPEAKECLSCHEDEHRGAMPRACESCHTPARWDRVDPRRLASTFDHASTGFVLQGSHAAVPCASCHDADASGALDGIGLAFVAGTEDRAFPVPEHQQCQSCHVDRHGGRFDDSPSGPDCAGCHGQAGWTPTSFDASRHDRETAFPLEGVHAVVACVDCHTGQQGPEAPLAVAGRECSACHGDVDPHLDQFTGRSCDQCHIPSAFDVLRFDHDRTRFPLDGEHRNATCRSCHVTETDPSGRSFVRYRPLGTECRDCHGGGA